MSRVGKKPILIPENVEVKIEGEKVSIRGPKGELSHDVRFEIKAEFKDGKIFVSPNIQTKRTKTLFGLERTLLYNMVLGVTVGYEKKLEIEGIGYRAAVEGDNIVLQVGFSHPVKIKAPLGIKFFVEKNLITVSGIDKELVGQVAAEIKRTKPPEPYKGKGIRYMGETIRKKAGKKAAAKT